MDLNLDYLNIVECTNIYRNLNPTELIEFAIKRGEGILAENGALVVNTGKYTGRSPKDRFIVKDEITENTVNWNDVNLPTDEKVFDNLYKQVTAYLKNKDIFVFDGYAGASKKYRIPIRVVCECAYQALFSNQLFRRPTATELSSIVPEFNIISAPGF